MDKWFTVSAKPCQTDHLLLVTFVNDILYNWLELPVYSSVSKLLYPPIFELRDLALVTPQL
jgi:hypothetical protein